MAPRALDMEKTRLFLELGKVRNDGALTKDTS